MSLTATRSPPVVRAATTELWRYKLDQPVGGSGVSCVDVVVVGIEDAEGQTGLGFSYVLAGSGELAARAASHFLAGFVTGRAAGHPEAAHRRMRQSLNRTGKGAAFVGLAAVDVALWDLHARQSGLPLGAAMGGESRSVNVYGSGGFRADQDPQQAADQAERYWKRGVRAVKLRVAGVPGDAAMIAAVQERLGPGGLLAVDANEKGTATAARLLARLAGEHGLLFVEEPLPAHDLPGYRALARCGASVATGEHLQGLSEAAPFLSEGLCSVIQPDLAMMGGLTECLRVARMAETCGIEVSPHFLPNLFVHLAAAAPNLTWLEDFPLLEPLFGSLEPFDQSGQLTMPQCLGHGLSWAPGAREGYKVSGY